MNKIYVSSGAFKTKNIDEVFELIQMSNLKNIEMTAGLKYDERLIEKILNVKNKYNILVHNYFPPQKNSFVLNLGSSDSQIIKKSLRLCEEAIILTSILGGEFYAIHCGFTFDSNGTHLGNKSQLDLPRISMNEALDIFVKNLTYLVNFAEQYNVKLAIENNVLAAFGLINNENILCLGTDAKSLNEIFKRVNHDNLYLLLDLGHAKVNKNTLNVSIKQIIDTLKHRIIGIHISDNDGWNDTNSKLTIESSVLPFLKEFKNHYIVLEVYNLTLEEIKEQLDIINSVIN